MQFNVYQGISSRTISGRDDLQRDLRQDGYSIDQLEHSLMGLADECGEIAKVLKRCRFYGAPVTAEVLENLKEEYGDLLWYVALGISALGLQMDTVATDNIAKLQKRYPSKYFTSADALARADKVSERDE